MRKPEDHLFADSEALAEALATDVATALKEAIAERGRATLAVSGGSTPKRFFAALSGKTLAWDKVTVTLVDERFVPETDERSNQRLVVSTLLQDEATRARFVPLYNAAASIEEAAEHASAVIAALPRPFDVVVLGMGTDGHTASFFPGGDRLQDALSDTLAKPVFAMEAPGAGEPRLTLSFAAIADAHLLVLHIEGPEKNATLKEAMKGGAEEEMPIRAVLNRAPSRIHLYRTE